MDKIHSLQKKSSQENNSRKKTVEGFEIFSRTSWVYIGLLILLLIFGIIGSISQIYYDRKAK
jgi:hypothetical protein